MPIDDRCDPGKNASFADILNKVGFDYAGVKPVEFTNPATAKLSAVILPRSKEDVVLVLLPGLGTSVLEHKKEVAESVHYLGSVNGIGKLLLLYKFQDYPGKARIEKIHDVVRQYLPGDTFDTIGEGINGRFHGYHNPDLDNPIALRIRKKF